MLLTCLIQSIVKLLNEINNDMIFIFTLLYVASERFHLFDAPKRSVRIKNYVIFPHYSIGMTRVKTAICRTSDLHHFCFLNNGDT